MKSAALTIDPDDVGARVDDSSLPAWLRDVASYVQQAADEGESVTLTAEQRMLTPEQVASMTGVSRSTISRRIKAGQIQAAKVGNRHRIPYDEFQRYWDRAMTEMAARVRDDIETELANDDR